MSIPVITTSSDLLFGVKTIEPVGEGERMRGAMLVDERHRGVDGRTAAGGLGVIADEVLGYSIIASLPADSWTISTEIWVDVLAPLPLDGVVRGEAHTIATGSFAVGRLYDDTRRLLMECRERGREVATGPDPDLLANPPVPEPPRMDGGLAGLMALELGEVSTMVVSAALQNPRRMLHGGVSLAACEVLATWSRVAAGSELPTSSLHIVHTRGAPAGSVVEFSARTVHAGRSLWVTDVTGSVEGKTVVSARVTGQ